MVDNRKLYQRVSFKYSRNLWNIIPKWSGRTSKWSIEWTKGGSVGEERTVILRERNEREWKKFRSSSLLSIFSR